MIRALLDTNTLFSGIYKADGNSGRVLRLGLAGTFEACVTEPIMEELMDVLERPRTRRLLYAMTSVLTPDSVAALVEQLGVAFTILPLSGITHEVKDDPDDSHVLSAAIQNEVDYIVSGDKRHILPLDKHPEMRRLSIRAVSPAQFLSVLAG
jgi:putative PIN family toxin of toxin-antitoxin system